MKGSWIRIGLMFLAMLSGKMLPAQNAEEGKKLFQANCSACHALNQKRVGPALAGTNEKYAGREEWLYKWIRNAPGLIASGDAEAVALWEANNKLAMTAFPNFTDEQIGNILAYIKAGDAPPVTAVAAQPAAGGQDVFADPAIYYSLLGLVGVLTLIALLLVIITGTLVTAIRSKEQKEPIRFADIWARSVELARNKFVVTAFTCFVIVMGGAKWIAEARTIGLHQGYMPTQPIEFSHKLHAGEYQIDCKYCHTGTTKSKSAWIPSANICMNCHKAIQNRHEVSKRRKGYEADGAVSPEIQKIYEAVGWDPKEFQYVAGYEEKPIEWIRIHNVPDHAYFNHAQHVVVGGLECQTCHGPVQEMEVVYQYTELGMGWCVNCHRQEKVKVLGQENSDGLTVEDMGGLNCARCHY
jgi:mono/diheme cytochrome c family protein